VALLDSSRRVVKGEKCSAIRTPRTPAVRISAKVIFVGRVGADMAHDSADLIDREAATALGAVAARAKGRRFGQQPRQMVFSLASNFEFSAASMSTTCPCSGGVSDAAGLASPNRVSNVAGLAAAMGGAALS
jgi:hypothetical protein